jgi:hypothetical protein
MCRKLVCGAVLVLVFSWVGRGDDAEDKAARWVGDIGGKVTRDDSRPGKPVVKVEFAVNRKVTNDDLQRLQAFPGLKELSLFFDEQITDAGMKHVKELKALERLTLNNTGVGDAGVAELKGSKTLKALRLAGCVRVTDASAEAIRNLAGLEELSLPSTFTDAGVRKVAGLTKLKKLYLGGAPVSDVGVQELAALKDLEELYLGTDVTDAGLDHLKGLKKLKVLNLHRSKVTDRGVEALKRALPDCAISRDAGHFAGFNRR